MLDLIQNFYSQGAFLFVADHLNDVIAEFGFYRLADLTHLHREGCIFKFFDHVIAREPTQVAAVGAVGSVG